MNTLVFISGIDGTADLFHSVADQLKQHGWRVLFYEHAHITHWNHCCDQEAFANEVGAFMDAYKADKSVICGESFGGPIALTFARLFPERTIALILLGTFAHLPFRRRAWLAKVAGRKLAVIARIFPARVLRITRRIYNPSVARSEPLALRQAIRSKPTPSLSTYLYKASVALAFDARPWLSQLTVPALVLTGEKDRMIPPQCSREIAALLPNAKLVTIPNSGHLSHYAYPQKFLNALIPFLKLFPPGSPTDE